MVGKKHSKGCRQECFDVFGEKKNHFLFLKSSYLPAGRIGSFKLWSFFLFQQWQYGTLEDVFFNITVKNMLQKQHFRYKNGEEIP